MIHLINEGGGYGDKTVDFSGETLRQSHLLSKQQSDHPREVIGVAEFILGIWKPISFPRLTQV